MIGWKFYFRNTKDYNGGWTEVQEPIGWDAVEFTTVRHAVYIGLEQEYSENLLFDGNGADYLMDIFDTYKFDAFIDFKVEQYCNNVLENTNIYSVNFITYSETNREVTIKVEDSSISRKLKNRAETVVSLDGTESIEGEELSAIQEIDLITHSKNIIFTAEFGLNSALRSFVRDSTAETGVINAHTPPFQKNSGDIEGANEPSDYLAPSQNPLNYIISARSINDPRTVTISGVLTITSLQKIYRDDASPTSVDGDGFVYNYAYSGGYQIRLTDRQGTVTLATVSSTDGTTALTDTVSFEIERTLDTPDDEIYIWFLDAHEETLPGTGTIERKGEYTYASESYLNLSEDSSLPATDTRSFKIYEVLNKVLETITDRTDILRSDFFGRTNSTPTDYTLNGCGSWLAVTNGLNIRNMRDKNNDSFPISISFKELFDALNTIYCIGLRVEIIDGLEYIRIEPREYFFDNETVMQFSYVKDIEITIATDKIYNEAEIGYQQWQVENVNGIDEFNTKRNYIIPVSTVKNKLTQISNMITAGYVIEMTRRQQFSTTPTTDWKYDNNNFLIALNRSTVNSRVSEKDEDFTLVENLFSPETAYNLRLSPLSCAQNWYKWISGTISHSPEIDIKFSSGEGNYQMRKQISDGCEPTSLLTTENDNLSRAVLSDNDSPNLFIPVYHSFEYPVNFSDYLNLRTNTNKSIEISCDASNFIKAFIEEMKYIPNTQDGGIIQIKALEGSCVNGAFDNSFDNSFDIGTCQ